MPSSSDIRAVILVEGPSDRRAVEVLAVGLNRDLDAEGVGLVTMNGITNLSRELDRLPPRVAVTLLYDRGEETWVERALARRSVSVTLHACDADLEDELIRALGVPAVLDVVAEHGNSAALETLCRQPFHRGRPAHDVLHRFLGTTRGRKIEYAGLLTAAAYERGCVPEPLSAVLADIS